MKHAKVLMLSVLLLGSGPLRAHTGLETASPADGAVVNATPSTLDLTFSDDVQLLKLDIVNAAGEAVATEFAPVAAAKTGFSVPLPVLAPAAYTVSWTILGADGHRVEGSFGFTVDPNVVESAGAASAHSGH